MPDNELTYANDLLNVFSTILDNLPENQLGSLHDIIYNKCNGIQRGQMDRFVKAHRHFLYAHNREALLKSELSKAKSLAERHESTVVQLRELVRQLQYERTNYMRKGKDRFW